MCLSPSLLVTLPPAPLPRDMGEGRGPGDGVGLQVTRRQLMSTSRLLFGTSELPASLLCCFGAIAK